MNGKIKKIGIVGGIGPVAGIDLVSKIFKNTVALKDSDHIPVSLISETLGIEDRTAFLCGKSSINPAKGIVKIIKKLECNGANIFGIACNAAHSPEIFNEVIKQVGNADLHVVNMVDEVVNYILQSKLSIRKVGILSIFGTYKSKVYENALSNTGIEIIQISKELQTIVHKAVRSPEYGIKAFSAPVSRKSRGDLMKVIDAIIQKEAEAIILGCTEIPIAIVETKIKNTVIIDPSLLLARALIREVNPEKLKN